MLVPATERLFPVDTRPALVKNGHPDLWSPDHGQMIFLEFDRWMKVVRIRDMSEEDEPIAESVLNAEAEEATEDTPEEAVKPRVELSGSEKRILDETLIRFTSCGRCSQFLAAYRLKHDDAELLAAVKTIENDWLPLPWDSTVRELLVKSYGCRIDMEAYYFESCCPECQSPFIVSEAENDGPYSLMMRM